MDNEQPEQKTVDWSGSIWTQRMKLITELIFENPSGFFMASSLPEALVLLLTHFEDKHRVSIECTPHPPQSKYHRLPGDTWTATISGQIGKGQTPFEALVKAAFKKKGYNVI